MSIKRIVTSLAIISSVLIPAAIPAATFAVSSHPAHSSSKSSLVNIGDINILDQNPFLNNDQFCSNISLIALLQGNKCVYN